MSDGVGSGSGAISDKMDILQEAHYTVNSNRQSEYGDPIENWVRTALIATITQGKSITPEDVIQTMCASKLVRAGRGHKRDTNVDQAGYAEIRERMQLAFKDGTVQRIVEDLLDGWVKFAKPFPTYVGAVTMREHGHNERTVITVYGPCSYELGDEVAIIKR